MHPHTQTHRLHIYKRYLSIRQLYSTLITACVIASPSTANARLSSCSKQLPHSPQSSSSSPAMTQLSQALSRRSICRPFHPLAAKNMDRIRPLLCGRAECVAVKKYMKCSHCAPLRCRYRCANPRQLTQLRLESRHQSTPWAKLIDSRNDSMKNKSVICMLSLSFV